MNKSMKCIILIFAVIMIMVITGLGFCKGRNQEKITKEKKIEKATHLLRYSDKSIIDIANYLSFSSQSHFIQTFENFTGMTPKKYRNKYYKSMW